MYKVIKIYPTGFSCNSYIVTADGESGILIDPGQESVMEDVANEKIHITHVLLTHGHFDHIGGCRAAQESGASVLCHETETEVIEKYNLAYEFGAAFPRFKPNGTFKEGDYDFGGIAVKVMETPGHTKGSVCFLIGDNLFTGDTLFCGNIGRTDFATGDYSALERSIKKLYALKGDYRIYAGHDSETTLERERKFNYYVRED